MSEAAEPQRSLPILSATHNWLEALCPTSMIRRCRLRKLVEDMEISFIRNLSYNS